MKLKLLLLALLLTMQGWGFTWPFPPTDVSTVGSESIPQIGVDSNGNAVAVWVRRISGNNQVIEASVFTCSLNTWSTPTSISATGERVDSPRVVVDGSGNAVAVWRRSDGSDFIIQAASLPFGGSWSAVTDLSAAGRDSIEPQVSINASGKAVAVWGRKVGPPTPPRSEVQAATLTFGGSWSAVTTISATPIISQDFPSPDVSIDPSGDAVAVFIFFQSGPPRYLVQAATLTSGSWNAAVTVTPSINRLITFPKVGVDSSGNAVANWGEDDGGTPSFDVIEEARYTKSTTTWSTPTTISVTGEDSDEQQLAVYPSGNAVAVWMRSDGSDSRIRAATFNGSTWATPQNISPAGSDSDQPRVSVDTAGDAFAVWRINGGTDNLTQGTNLDSGSSTWASPTSLSQTGANATTPFVSSSGTEKAIAVWERAGIIQASTSPLIPPSLTGEQCVNWFPTQSELVNILRWTASPSPDIVSYRIYRNGVLIATVPSTQLMYEDHNRIPGESTTYGVSAVNSCGAESAQATVTIP